MVDSNPTVNPQDKIQFHSFVGYWAGQNGTFYGGKTNIIKEDGKFEV